jgi:hypothetical protein
MAAINYKGWKRHFTKDPRSTEMVQMPRDIFDFLLETNEAYSTVGNEDIPTVVACQLMALRLLKEVEAANHRRSPPGPM